MAVDSIRVNLKRVGITGGFALVYLARVFAVNAYPVPDTTLQNHSIVNTSNNTSTITGGTTAGHNLFHSFERFNVGQGEVADFVSPSAVVRNILVRVTGGSRSRINGTLRTSGLSTPNLFLINPSGISFGQNARLNIGGSFISTTANAVGFGAQGFFSASAPNDPTLLTVNPSAFLFSHIRTRSSIETRSAGSGNDLLGGGLEVPNGQSLLFLGGNVSLDEGVLTVPDGRVEMGGLAEAGIVGFNRRESHLYLDFPDDRARADVSLKNGALIDLRGNGSGSFAINARDIHIADSSVQSGINFNSGSINNQRGSIVLNAVENLRIAHAAIVNSSGNIQIRAESLSLEQGSQLSNSSLSRGGSGNIIIINASEQVFLDFGFIYNENFEAGQGGSITINAHQGTISLVDASLISARTSSSGNGGNISIWARELSLSDGSQVTASTVGSGESGNIQVRTTDAIRLIGVDSDRNFSSGLITSSEERGSGRGGNITIDTGLLSLADGAVLSARTRSASRGGDITVNAERLEAIDGGQVITSTFSSGSAGNITIDAQDQIILSGADPTYADRITQVNSNADRLGVIDNDSSSSGIFARARTETIANAGDITITAPFLYLNDQGRIGTDTTAGRGGAIRLQNLDLLLMRRNSSISASAGTANRGGDGGNISIASQFILVAPSENSDITANAFTGRGGNVSINAEGLLGIRSQLQPTPASDITASSERGVQGNVTIRSPEVNPTQGLVELPTNLIDASKAIAPACPTEDIMTANNSFQNQFIVTGRGGLPLNADEALSSNAVQVDLVTAEVTETASERALSLPETHPTEKAIVEAQGWIVDADGNVILTASAPTAIAQNSRPNLIAMECPAQSRSSS